MEINIEYKDRYLKYKSKYLNLQKQLNGGGLKQGELDVPTLEQHLIVSPEQYIEYDLKPIKGNSGAYITNKIPDKLFTLQIIKSNYHLFIYIPKAGHVLNNINMEKLAEFFKLRHEEYNGYKLSDEYENVKFKLIGIASNAILQIEAK